MIRSHFVFLFLLLFSASPATAQAIGEGFPSSICTEKTLCVLAAAEDGDQVLEMEVEPMAELLHAVFTDLGIQADFYISDGVMGEETGTKLWSYMEKMGYRTFIGVAWGKGKTSTSYLGKERPGEAMYVLSAYPVTGGKPGTSPSELYVAGSESSGEMVAKLQARVEAHGKNCSRIENPDVPIFVSLVEVDLPRGKQREVHDGWPTNLKNGTLVVPLYPTIGAFKSGDKRQDKRSERFSGKMNKHILRKNEDLKATMKKYDHAYVIVESGKIDQYKGKEGHYLLLDRARDQKDRVYDASSGTYKFKTRTYYRYALKDLSNGDVWEGNGKESSSYVNALRYLLKFAEK